MSLKIDRKGAGSGFCFTRNGEIDSFVGRPWPAPEKILKSLRYWANVQYRHIGSKGHNENPGFTLVFG